MGLGDYAGSGKGQNDSTDSNQSSDSKSSSNSSSSSGSTDEFPKFKRKQPQYVLKKVMGDYKLEQYPNTVAMEFQKDWYSAPWEPADHLPGNWEEVWWDEDQFKLDKYIVEEELNEDLLKMLKDNPEVAIRMLRKAKESYNSEGDTSEAAKRRRCDVCGSLINLCRSDYEEIGTKIACKEHTLTELKEEGLV